MMKELYAIALLLWAEIDVATSLWKHARPTNLMGAPKLVISIAPDSERNSFLLDGDFES